MTMPVYDPLDLIVDDVALGRVPLHESLVYHGVIPVSIARADSAAGTAVEAAAEAVGEKVAPPLANDTSADPALVSLPEPDPDEQDLAETLALVSQACEHISARLDKLRADRARTDAILEKLSATIQ